MIIECNSAQQWLQTLRQRYDIDHTILNHSQDAFTVLLTTNNSNKTMLVGRYCRVNHFGIVICRRNIDTGFEYERRTSNASPKKD
jgi:hypothetical protein